MNTSIQGFSISGWIQTIVEILSSSAKDVPSLLSKTPFWSQMCSAILDLLLRRRRTVRQNTLLACQWLESSLYPKMSQDCILEFVTVKAAKFPAHRTVNAKSRLCCEDGCFARILIDLLVIGVNIMYEILSILHFRLFHHDYYGLSRLNVVPMRITFGFVLQINLAGYFCCPNSISHLLVPLRVTFLLLFAASSRFRPNTRTADETFATQPRRPLCIVGVLETRAIRCMQRPFLHFCSPRSPTLYLLGWWSVESSTLLLTRTSNTVCNKSPETMKKSMSDRWPKDESLHQVYLCKQHSCSRSLTLSHTSASSYRPITPFRTPASFLTCALKSYIRIANSFV